MATTTTTEDFTFPIFSNDPFSSGIDSPSLWHLSPSASPDHHSCHKTTTKQEQEQEQEQEESDQEEEFQDCFPLHKTNQRKSYSWVEYKGSKDDKEEKMDLLWEDFNEEVSSSLNRRSHQLQSLRLTKTSTAMVSPKKPATTAAGFVVFIKVLKKLFLLHNSPHHPRMSVQTHHSRNRRAKNRSW